MQTNDKDQDTLPVQEEQPESGAQGSERPQHELLTAGAILILALALTYGPAKLAGHVIYTGVIQDVTNLYGFHCWDAFSAQELAAGRVPLWNPFNALGTPHLADMQTAVFYPLNWLKFVFGFWHTIDAILMIRLWLAGFFTFAFVRRAMEAEFWPAALAGVSFMLTGYFTRYVYMSHLNVECLLPLQMYLLFRLWERASLWRFLLSSLGFALLVLGGFPEASLYCILLPALYYLFKSGFKPRPILILGVALAAGFLISLLQWLPFAEYLSLAWTYHDPASGMRHLDIDKSISLVLPWFFGENRVSQAAPFLVPYLGVIPAMLFFYLLARLREAGRDTLLFAGGAIVLLLLIYGMPPISWLGRLFPFSLTYNDKYAIPAMAFCVAVCAGMGLDMLLDDDGPLRFGLAAIVTGLWMILGVIIAFDLYKMGLMKPGMVITALALAALAFCLQFMHSRSMLSRTGLAAGLFVLCLGGLAYDQQGNTPVYNDELPKRTESMERAFAQAFGKVRVHADPDLNFLFPDLLLPARASDIRSYQPLYPKNYVEFMAAVNDLSGDSVRAHYDSHMLFVAEDEKLGSPLLRLANVVLYVTKNALYRLPAAVEDRSTELIDKKEGQFYAYKDQGAFPRFYLAKAYGVPPEGMSLNQAAFDIAGNNPNVFKNLVVLGEKPDEEGAPAITEGDTALTLQAQDYEPGRIVLDYSIPYSGFLVSSDGYFPGWRAFVDKGGGPQKETRVMRANGPFEAVSVPAGKGKVILSYRPWAFRIGLWASLVVFGVVAILFFLPKAKRGAQTTIR